MGIKLDDLPLAVRERIARHLLTEQASKQQHTKYRNTATVVDASAGLISFKSKKEENRYHELMLLLKTGTITDLKLQPAFTLIESYRKPTGEKVGRMKYTADFSYIKDGKLVVEDVKSHPTQTTDYKMRKKLMLDIYGINICEV